MGQRLAPTLAIVFMSKVEAPVLARKPLLHCRYVDDCCVICPTQAELDACFTILNQQSPHIKMTREKPTDNWLPFLNVQMQLSGGTFRTRWYRKPSSKNVLVHYTSAHPAQVKKSIVANMYRTAMNVSSDRQQRDYSLNLADHIAKSNGYKRRKHFSVARRLINLEPPETDNKISF